MAVTYHEDGSSTKSIDERQTAKKNKNKNTKEPDYKSNDLKFGKIAKGNSSLQKEFKQGYGNA